MARGCSLISCLVCIFFWLGHWSLISSYPTFPNDKNPLMFYANQTGTNLHLLFCEALEKARHCIFLEMYAITDPLIIQMLCAKAAQGVDIHILTDKDASHTLQKKIPSSIKLHVHSGRGLMHRKVVVIDHVLTLLGSVNLTTSSLTLHDNFALAMKDEKIATFFEESREHEGYFTVGEQRVLARKLPKNGKEARETILGELAQAKHSIYVAMFTLTDHILVRALLDAHKRGVRVLLALDYYTAEGTSKKAYESLVQAGIPVKISLGAQLLHHKWALIDNTTLATGSTNWTKSAFAYNHDDFVIIHHLTKEQQKMMLRLWRKIESMAQHQ